MKRTPLIRKRNRPRRNEELERIAALARYGSKPMLLLHSILHNGKNEADTTETEETDTPPQ